MSAAWHDEARVMLESGVKVPAIAAALGRGQQSVRWALDINGEREKHRQRVETGRKRDRTQRRSSGRGCGTPHAHPGIEASRNPLAVADDHAAARAYTKPDRARPKPSLPSFSMPPAIEDERPAFKLAPKVRMTGSPGAERWRQIHLAMIRAGKIAQRGDLVSEIAR
ncbi:MULTISPECIES: hypothetical protein [unclassified Bosea (in: a-proteobacteria)]|uniref:hypothetical protein n=1 Tax=unclassified Bosea (in: a-proteobacteria) TaxID=2653178 RepID=UPI000F7EED17|nr:MULTISPECIES: hypothetical protein [unclassified Bosea (in: a-proteobacteria)]